MKNNNLCHDKENKSFSKQSAEFHRACIDETQQALLLCEDAQRLRDDIAKARQEVIRELGRGGPKLVQPS